ncbi:MAG: amidohydrolase family protein [Gammaproteobacteria bacterium]
MLKPTTFHVVALVGLALAVPAVGGDFEAVRKAANGTFDVFIDDARVIDGTGRPAYRADLLIKGDTIVFMGDVPAAQVEAARTIHADGRVLSPGFIDTHAHGDAEKDDFDGFLAMGVTSIVLGQDGENANAGADADGGETLAVWMKRVEALPFQLNVIPLSGHGSLRHLAQIPDSARAISAEQQARMNHLVEDDLRAGSFGLSTGLEYVPGRYAETGELASLAKQVAKADGIIISHMRSEDDGLIEGAVEELVSYGGGARIQASHLKIVFGKQVAAADRLLALIARKQAQGVRLSADVYPYTAGYTYLGVIFPEWALPPSDYRRVLAERRDELRDYLRARMIKRGGPDALLFGSEPFSGKTLATVAKERGVSFEEVLLDLGPLGGSGAHFTQDAKVQDRLVVSPLTAISTDAAPGLLHPRATGTYARLIEHYVMTAKSLTLEEAVRKASGLPAASLGLSDRGVVKEGAKADLLLFDPAKVHARSDYLQPYVLATGFDFVFVNGSVAREGDAKSTARHGRLLKKN